MTSVSYRLGAFALILGMLAVIDASNATNMAALTGALLMLLRSLSYGQATQTAIQTINEAIPVVDQLLVESTRFQDSAQRIGTDRTYVELITTNDDAAAAASTPPTPRTQWPVCMKCVGVIENDIQVHLTCLCDNIEQDIGGINNVFALL